LTVRAYELRDRLSWRERYLVEAWYHLSINGDVDKSITAFRRLLEDYPDDKMILHNLAYDYFLLRDFGQVEELESRAIEADSSYSYAWQALFTAVMNQGRLDEAEILLHRWARQVPTSTAWFTEAASLAVNRGDFSGAVESAIRRRERAGETRAAQLDAEINSSGLLADLAMVRGKLSEAERHLRHVLAHLEELGDSARYLQTAIKIAILHAWHRADTSTASRVLGSALERIPFDSLPVLQRPYLQLVRYYALAGEPERSRTLLEKYESTVSPALRPGFGLTHNRLLGIVALSEGNLDEAIEQLGVRDRYLCAICALPSLGRAYESAGDLDTAIAAYERYVNTPYNWRLVRSGDEEGLKDAFWLPVVYERLARLYDQRGEVERAIHYYGRFADLWEDADPDLRPRVEAARRAVERLVPDG
jgi:tetratricopeptide (TPR) repeat protein